MSAHADFAPFDVIVPGSTSNLGPGFDALGLALDLELRVRVEPRPQRADGGVSWEFVSPTLVGDNLVDAGLRAGLEGREVPALHARVVSDIPLRAGLGSSAAAIVAGLRIAARFAPRSTADLLRLATHIEGHPDNVSASLLGGLTVSCVENTGAVRSMPTRWPEAWRLVMATPAVQLATAEARAALPERVPLRDAIANVQRAALLVRAVHAEDAAAMREALRDRLHQPYRARLVPGLEQALDFHDRSLIGVYLSGAGPTIAAVVTGDGRAVCDRFRALYDDLGLPCAVRLLGVRQPFTA